MSAYQQDCFVIFDCPRGVGVGKGRCQALVKGPDATWKNIGTAEKPTLQPSYNCVGGCGWHGYIVDGEAKENPVVQGAAASISTLHDCAACGHPEIMTVGLTPQPTGALNIAFQRTEVRKPASNPDASPAKCAVKTPSSVGVSE